MCQHSREVVPKYGLTPAGPEATDSHCLAPIYTHKHTHTHTHNLIRMLRELLDHIMPHLRRDLGLKQTKEQSTHSFRQLHWHTLLEHDGGETLSLMYHYKHKN